MNRLSILLRSIKNKFSGGATILEPKNRISVAINSSDVENERLKTLILTSAEITKISTQQISTQELIKQIVEILQHRLDLYFVGVYLIDKSREYAVLHYGTGDEGHLMLNASYRLVIGGISLVGRSAKSKNIETITTDENDPTRFENPFLSRSESEAAIPILLDDLVLGILNIHFNEPLEMDSNTKIVLENAANILALTLQKNSELELRTDQTAAPKAQGEKNHHPKFISREIFQYKNPEFRLTNRPLSKIQIPLTFHDQPIGNLELETTEVGFKIEETEFVQEVTQQAIIHLENLLKIEEKQSEIDFEKIILESTSKIRSTNEPQKMLKFALEEISKNLNVTRLQIVLNVPESPPSVKPLNHDTQSLVNKAKTDKLPKA